MTDSDSNMKRGFDIMQLINIFVSRDTTRGVFNKQDCLRTVLFLQCILTMDEVSENDKRISWKKLETKLSQ